VRSLSQIMMQDRIL